MPQWIVARRPKNGGTWTVCPQVFSEEEAQNYAGRLDSTWKVVGLDLDSLPELPTFTASSS